MLVFITGLCNAQNLTNVCYRTEQSVVIVDEPQNIQLSPAVMNIQYSGSQNTNTKIAAVAGYVLLNSFVITEYCISNNSWKKLHPNYEYWNNTNHQNQVPGSGYPDVKKPSPLGMISTAVLSTGLLVTILISF